MRELRAIAIALLLSGLSSTGAAAQELVTGECSDVDPSALRSAIEARLYTERSDAVHVALDADDGACRAWLTDGEERTGLGEIGSDTSDEDIEAIASRAAFLISSGWPLIEIAEPEPDPEPTGPEMESAVLQARAISNAAALAAFADARVAAGTREPENPDLAFLSIADERVAGQSFSIFDEAGTWSEGRKSVPFVAVFVPTIHTPLPVVPHVVHFSFEFVGGPVQAIEGAQIAVIGTVGTEYFIGARFAGIYAVSRGPVLGAQFAGAANVVEGPVGGAQAAFAVNIAEQGVRGAQIAAVNINGGPLEGAQLGTVNLNGGTVHGAQLGMVNIAESLPAGAQAGMVNIAGDGIVQTGMVNIGGDTTVQTGMVNVAGRTGVQVGMVNVAQDADVSLGMINVVRERPIHFTLTGNERGVIMAGARHGSRYIQNTYELGFSSTGENHLYIGTGLGAEGNIGPLLTQFDLVCHTILQLESTGGSNQSTTARLVGTTGEARLTLGASIGRLALFAGPTYTVHYAQDSTFGVPPAWARDLPATGRDRWSSWPGFRAGLRF